MFVVVCYDISDDRLRKKISDYLEGYGIRVQRSVFECEFSSKKVYEKVKEDIKKLIDRYGFSSKDVDDEIVIDTLDSLVYSETVRFYVLDKRCKVNVDILGNGIGVYEVPPYEIV